MAGRAENLSSNIQPPPPPHIQHDELKRTLCLLGRTVCLKREEVQFELRDIGKMHALNLYIPCILQCVYSHIFFSHNTHVNNIIHIAYMIRFNQLCLTIFTETWVQAVLRVPSWYALVRLPLWIASWFQFVDVAIWLTFYNCYCFDSSYFRFVSRQIYLSLFTSRQHEMYYSHKKLNMHMRSREPEH
jgi:hypothetical protein